MSDTIIEVQQGKLRGKIGSDYKGGKFYSFQGIPYAKPPLGDLRFKAPVDPEPWQGIRDAVEEASDSLARHFHFHDKVVGSEDCLYLNVYTPEWPNNKDITSKPVMFWIHGGGFTLGSGSTEVYGPEILITGDIVLVTVNYRLGILGFLRLENPALGVPGNAGMKDIVMALKWVQRNIETFGGDPNNVTIFGESAGSASVHGLILSPMAEGLFHRAIMQSGSILDSWVFGGEKASTVAKLLGNESENEKDILEFLKSVPEEKILEAQDNITDDFNWNHIRPFGMVVEQNASEQMFLSEHPLHVIKSGNYNKVPIIMGYTSKEGLFLLTYHKKLFEQLQSDNNFENKIPHYLNVPKGTELSLKIANKIKEAYHGLSNSILDDADIFFTLVADAMSLRGTYNSINAHLQNLRCPIYLYLLSAETDVNFIKTLSSVTLPGACHADDLGYLFNTSLIPGCKESSLEELITQRMVKLWTNFARSGNPNPVDHDPLINVEWKPIQQGQYDLLDIGAELEFGENPDFHRMKVWYEIDSLIANFAQAELE